jgi:hypothetical protein
MVVIQAIIRFIRFKSESLCAMVVFEVRDEEVY